MTNGPLAISQPGHHPIQVAAQRAGISVHLIRAWERRYDAVVPDRTVTGRRVYSDADIERLRLLNRAVEGGRRIGDVAGLTTEALATLVNEDRVERRVRTPAEPRPGPSIGGWEPAEVAYQAVLDFDQEGLRTIISRALATMSLADFVDGLVQPLMQRIGSLWAQGELSASHEHLATASLRSALGELLERVGSADRAPAVVVGTTSGQRHELGALIAAVTAALAGWRPIFLGADLPADDIAQAVRDSGARAVALSVTDPNIKPDLHRLRERLGPAIPILLGGQGASAVTTPYPVATQHLETIADLRTALLSLT